MPRKDVATQAGKVLTPILVLPWHGASAAQRGRYLCNAVLPVCAMWCSVLCSVVLSSVECGAARLSTCRMQGKVSPREFRGSADQR